MFSSIRSRSRTSPRRGLTLVELVVVLTILVALGGLIVPMIPSMLAKTHRAKCAVTIPEINKLWITKYSGDVVYPDAYDSMITGSSLYNALPGGDAGGEVSAGTLTADEADALAAIGVTTVIDHASYTAGQNATLDSPTTPRPLAGGGAVALLNNAGGSVISLGIDVAKYAPDTKFVVLGIGNGCDACGPKGLMVEAPTHFGGEDVMNPVEFYQRYCVIFAVSETDGAAEFVCACSIHPDGFDGGETHIHDYYEAQQG